MISSIIEPAVERGELQVFPNPARDKVVCRIVNNETTLMSVSMYDMLGETISAPITRGSDNTITLSVDGIVDGIYVIQAKDNLGKMYQRKISIFK